MPSAPTAPDARPKRFRANQSPFNVNEMYELLAPIAKKRNLGFKWDGSDYPRKRSSTPDVQHLEITCPVLEVLAMFAPNGYPSHSDLRKLLVLLDIKFHILQLGDNEDKRFQCAGDAADLWRIMTKHTLSLKQSKRTLKTELRKVVDSMVVDKPVENDDIIFNDDGFPAISHIIFDDNGCPAHSPQSAASPSSSASASASADSADGDGDDCVLIAITCSCANCRRESGEIGTPTEAHSEPDVDIYVPPEFENDVTNEIMEWDEERALEADEDVQKFLLDAHRRQTADILAGGEQVPPASARIGGQKKETLKVKSDKTQLAKGLKEKKRKPTKRLLKKTKASIALSARPSNEVLRSRDFQLELPVVVLPKKSKLKNGSYSSFFLMRDNAKRHIYAVASSRSDKAADILATARDLAGAGDILMKSEIVTFVEAKIALEKNLGTDELLKNLEDVKPPPAVPV